MHNKTLMTVIIFFFSSDASKNTISISIIKQGHNYRYRQEPEPKNKFIQIMQAARGERSNNCTHHSHEKIIL
jgi:hypothetical protein